MRKLAFVLLSVVLVACAGQKEPEPQPEPEPPVMTVDDPAVLVASRELRGYEVEEETDGVWVVRRAGASAGGGAPGGRPMPPSSPRMRAEGGAAAPGGEAPTMDAGEATGAPDDSADRAPETEDAREAHGGSATGGASGPPVTKAAPLRAGATDDNEDFAAYLAFLARWSDRPEVAGRHAELDVRERRFVRVLDAEDRPVPAARVRILDERRDALVWDGTTYGDGRVPFYPRVALGKGTSDTVADGAGGGFLVEVVAPSGTRRLKWDGSDPELVVRLEGARVLPEPLGLDVTFVIDTTGSMGDEIQRIKATLLRVTERLRSLGREFDLRYGAVLYRDLGDEYVTRTHPFTKDIEALARALESVRAAGGGDGPESLNQGLAEAVGRLEWRPDAAKVAFLIADAPPHMDYPGDVSYGRSLVAAVGRGIRIHSVAASGLGSLGSLVFRQVAQFTRGKFIFIEYGTPAESAASHGVGGSVKSNNLDDIVFEQIRDEIARWGR